MNVTEQTAAKLRRLQFDPHASPIAYPIPLGSIAWSDEFPADDLFSSWDRPDHDQILKLYTIRIHYWNTGDMRDEDASYWESARVQFPQWPFFQRRDLSPELRHAHEAVMKNTEDFLVALISEADTVETGIKDGVMRVSTTFHLKHQTKKPWWRFWS